MAGRMSDEAGTGAVGVASRGERFRQTRSAMVAAAVALAIGVTGVLRPTTAEASPSTLRRSLSNIMLGPADIALSPFVGAKTLATNLSEIEDTPGVRLTYALPGYAWITGMNFGSGVIRIVTGVLELPVGLVLLPFDDTDMDPLFDAVDDAGAWFEIDNPVADLENPWIDYNPLLAPFTIPLKFGIDYSHPTY